MICRRHRRCVLACAMLVLACVFRQATANNASPHPVQVTQPDGRKISLILRGTEYLHWYEDTQGYTVLQRDDRSYTYATLGTRSTMVASDRLVGVDTPPAELQKHLIPPPFGRELRMPRLPARMSQAPQRTSTAGQVKNVVVLMRFSNHTNRQLPPPSAFNTIFNAPGGDPTLAPTGSVRDFYLENSYGALDLSSTVFAWVTLPRTEQYYANGDSGLTPKIAEAIRDALVLADAQIDFSKFDGDHDGWVDAIAFVHSGYAAEFGGVDADGVDYKDRIWSHRWSIPTWNSAEGVKISDYHINPGLWGTSGSDPGRIGVICHETGHFFGLPDLYDVSQQGEGDGSWELMANSWGFDGTQLHPPHLGGWSKAFLGWLTPKDISSAGTYSVPQVETRPSPGSLPTVFRISSGFPADEYLLVENRQPVGFDSGIPSTGSGLAIWHVDELKPANDDPGFPGQSGWPSNNKHYKVALLQADGKYDLERGINRGDAGDLYRKGFKDHIDETTVPSSDKYQFGTVGHTGVNIHDISASGSTMTFQLSPPSVAPPITSADGTTAEMPPGAIPSFAAAHEFASRVSGGSDKEFVRVMSEALHAIKSDTQVGVPGKRNLLPQEMAIGSTDERIVSESSLYSNPTWLSNQQRLWTEVTAKAAISTRIFGGSECLPGEFPHCVAIGTANRFCCTGTLIGPKVVLTAGHCVDGACSSRVYFGLDSNTPDATKIVNVAAAILHPGYDRNTFANDVALLILSQPVPAVDPVPIADSADIDNAFFLRLAGYGFTEFGRFGVQMTVDVAVASADCACAECPRLYGCHIGREIVAGGNGVDSCNGDSGGPAYIVKNNTLYLAGSTSRATRNSVQQCGDGGIYVRADKHLDWIRETAALHGASLDGSRP